MIACKMTKKLLIIILLILGCITSTVCFLGYFGVIQNGVILGTVVKIFSVCVLLITGIYLIKFRNFDKCTYAAVVAMACTFIIVAH